jgi:peptidoglycan-associated lipoprotein
MTYKKFGLSLGVVLAMVLAAGCSTNKADDSANQNGANGAGSGSSNSGFDSSANGNGSDMAQNGRVVYFGLDQSTLSSDAQSVLDSNISALKSGSQHIRLEGHADERGTREYNLALGERRANAVLQYLVANGVSKARLETISYGKERPADAGHDESAWAKNRRVEIVLN